MHQKTLAQKVQTVYFVAVATLMYYFIDSVLQLSIYISFHHAFALLLDKSQRRLARQKRKKELSV